MMLDFSLRNSKIGKIVTTGLQLNILLYAEFHIDEADAIKPFFLDMTVVYM